MLTNAAAQGAGELGGGSSSRTAPASGRLAHLRSGLRLQPGLPHQKAELQKPLTPVPTGDFKRSISRGYNSFK